MHAAYVHEVNAVVAAGNEEHVHELAQSFDEESLSEPGARAHVGRSV